MKYIIEVVDYVDDNMDPNWNDYKLKISMMHY